MKTSFFWTMQCTQLIPRLKLVVYAHRHRVLVSSHAKVTLIAMGVPAAGIMGRVGSAVPGRTRTPTAQHEPSHSRTRDGGGAPAAQS